MEAGNLPIVPVMSIVWSPRNDVVSLVPVRDISGISTCYMVFKINLRVMTDLFQNGCHEDFILVIIYSFK